MKKHFTGREIQRVDFAESLYKSLKQKAKVVEASQQRWLKMASLYLEDGMEESECIELLEIDGLSKEAARGYTSMAMDSSNGDSGEFEYVFKFEDMEGKIWSSSDMGKIIKASSDEEAWTKAEDVIFSDINECEPERLISIDRLS